MECNKDEAMRAKNLAEKKMIYNDFEGARKFALKAQKLYPELENIPQMVAVCDVHCAAAKTKDLYGILQVESLADVATIKKQYRKLALVLHPDKNQFPGAESAFKLIGEAHMILSDNAKRSLYDYKYSTTTTTTVMKPQNPQPLFWTICIFCDKRYQYCRDMVNKSIKCSNCSKVFTAVDIKPTDSSMQNVNPEPSFSQCTKTRDGKEECCKRSRVSNDEDCGPKRRSQYKHKIDKEEEDAVFVDIPDLEFSNFDKDKEEDCFAVDQIWAVYDTIDSMPRFYAQIRKVYSSGGFRLRITWLEADPENLLERTWAEEGLPVACGRFKRGASEETNDRLMFSHQMAVALQIEKGKGRRKRFSFVVYPKRGEIWALFNNWDIIKWTSDSEHHMKYKFEIVEILSDYDEDNGVVVGYMVKVKGFVSLFQKAAQVNNEYRVPPSDLFRFSHNIPSLKLTGNERANVPVGSFELDTASLPDDLVNAAAKDKESKLIIVHDFTFDKQNLVFEVGQIWAVAHHKCYAQIKKIESGPPLRFMLHVDLLELCGDTVRRPYACGLYKTLTGGRKILHQDSFLYCVKAQVNGRNRFNIYPRKNEIWAFCKDADVDVDVVQVVENNGDVIEVSFLTRVGGYKSLFKGGDRVVEVSIAAESDRFLYRVPAVCLTDQQNGQLRGFWELDVAEFPGLVLG